MQNKLYVTGNADVKLGDCFNVKITEKTEAGFKASCTVAGRPAFICSDQTQGVRVGDVWHVTYEGVHLGASMLVAHEMLTPGDGMTLYLSGYCFPQVLRVRNSKLLLEHWQRDVSANPGRIWTWKEIGEFITYATETVQSRRVAPQYRCTLGRELLRLIRSLNSGIRDKAALQVQDIVSAIAFNTDREREKEEMLKQLYQLQEKKPLKDKKRHKQRQAIIHATLAEVYRRRGRLDLALSSYQRARNLSTADTVYLESRISELKRHLGPECGPATGHVCAIVSGEFGKEPAARTVSPNIDED